MNLLRAMSSLSKKHNPTLLCQIYNSTIRSIFEYPSICIVNAANTHIDKLQIIQNEALRIILKVPSYVPIVLMNDAANQKFVREHLSAIAEQKIRCLNEKSRYVQKTVDKYRSIRLNSYNMSPLDIITI